MNAVSTLNRLYDGSLAFRLYAEHANGMTVAELALMTSRSQEWVAEQIEAMRLCLEKQLVIDVQERRDHFEEIWAEQVWD